MTTYRAYRVDRRRHILNGQWLEARDDADAKDQAEELCEEGAPRHRALASRQPGRRDRLRG